MKLPDNHLFYDYHANISKVFSFDIAAANRMFCDIVALLNSKKVKYFVGHGTLLGIIRDQSLIPHDRDIDIYLIDGTDTLLFDIVKQSENLGFNFLRYFKNLESSIGRGNFYIDFEMLAKNKDYYEFDGYRYHETALVLDTIKFLGQDVSVPKYPEKFLESWYGSEWQTLNKGWKSKTWDGKSVRGTVEKINEDHH